MTNRRSFIKQSLAAAGATVIPSAAFAAAAQEDKSKPKYKPSLQEYLPEGAVGNRKRIPDCFARDPSGALVCRSKKDLASTYLERARQGDRNVLESLGDRDPQHQSS